MSPRNFARSSSSIGRANRDAGAAFETWIDLQHERAGQLGILAHVVHNEAHSEVMHGQLIHKAPGVADYSGVLHGGGYICVEAKSTSEERLARAEVKPLQQAHLEAVSRAGGNSFALLLVEFRHKGEFHRYAVPWAQVPWVVLRTAESVAEVDLSAWKISTETYLSRFHSGSENCYIVGAAKMAKRIHPRA